MCPGRGRVMGAILVAFFVASTNTTQVARTLADDSHFAADLRGIRGGVAPLRPWPVAKKRPAGAGLVGAQTGDDQARWRRSLGISANFGRSRASRSVAFGCSAFGHGPMTPGREASMPPSA